MRSPACASRFELERQPPKSDASQDGLAADGREYKTSDGTFRITPACRPSEKFPCKHDVFIGARDAAAADAKKSVMNGMEIYDYFIDHELTMDPHFTQYAEISQRCNELAKHHEEWATPKPTPTWGVDDLDRFEDGTSTRATIANPSVWSFE